MTNLQERIRSLPPEKLDRLLRRMRQAGGSEPSEASIELPTAASDPAALHEPFPLTDVQRSYAAGRSPLFCLAGGGANLYLEQRTTGMSDMLLAGFEGAVRALIARHDMLRAVLRADGRQQILRQAPPYEVEVRDLRGLAAAAVDAVLERARQELRYRRGDPFEWPLFDFVVHRLDGDRLHFHARLDALLSDGTSRRILMQDLMALWAGTEPAGGAPQLSYRDYVGARGRLEQTELYRRSRTYWLERIERLPPPPAIPLLRSLEQQRACRFSKQILPMLGAQQWQRLKERAAGASLTPSACLTAACIEALAAQSGEPRFTLTLVGSHRPPVHPRIGDVVGNFNTLHLFSVDLPEAGFEVRARRVQEELAAGLEHRYFSGFEVIREYRRRRGVGPLPPFPVLFNSVVEYSHPLWAGEAGDGPGREEGYEREVLDTSLYPSQVLVLVVMAEESDGSLSCESKWIEGLVDPVAMHALVASYAGFLCRLAADHRAWLEVPDLPRGTWHRAEGAGDGRLGSAEEVRPAPPGSAPADTYEQQIAGLWRDVLATGPVDSSDSFFDLGGDSFRLTLLEKRLRDTFGRAVLDREFFLTPTIAHLAARLRREAAQ